MEATADEIYLINMEYGLQMMFAPPDVGNYLDSRRTKLLPVLLSKARTENKDVDLVISEFVASITKRYDAGLPLS